MMRTLHTAILALVLIFGTLHATAQAGYLGKRELVTIDITDRLLNSAWSVGLLHSLSNSKAIRFDVKLLTADRDLQYPSPNWMGLNSGKTVGKLIGAGTSVGIHYCISSSAGLSTPQGFYMSFGMEYFLGRTNEKMTPAQVTQLDPTILPAFREPLTSVDFKHQGLRVLFGWGVRHVLTGSIMLDAGVVAGLSFMNTARSSVDQRAPLYMFPYEKTSLRGDIKNKGDGKFSYGPSVVFSPFVRVGWLF